MNRRTLVLKSLMLGVLVCAVSAANAQPAKPAARPDAVAAEEKAAAPNVPKHKCERPDMPAKFENDAQQQAFVKQMDGYRDCLMAYRNEMNKLAQAHIAAANGAIDEFNAFVKAVNSK
jgi:hypothetical protein